MDERISDHELTQSWRDKPVPGCLEMTSISAHRVKPDARGSERTSTFYLSVADKLETSSPSSCFSFPPCLLRWMQWQLISVGFQQLWMSESLWLYVLLRCDCLRSASQVTLCFTERFAIEWRVSACPPVSFVSLTCEVELLMRFFFSLVLSRQVDVDGWITLISLLVCVCNWGTQKKEIKIGQSLFESYSCQKVIRTVELK